ncbi:DarT ssDNA thymidine ADP-ribosyltransferase family protein [Slackia isoflavoniconvertens]|uniref:DarT ssDNA thymidine ADP-ribosyltransferase family protein n=1 Tax=Slackia isoflavoniconvertens TaxID=572010 RepID=UPI003FD6CC4E
MLKSVGMQAAESDLEYLRDRKVEYFVHFTSLDNVPSILDKGLLTRQELDDQGVGYAFNDARRLDGRGHVNLSITHPNIPFFFKTRKAHPDRCYVVLRIDPEALVWLAQQYGKDSYCFYSTNAAANRATRCNVEQLFAGPRLASFDSNWTTDVQAELVVNHAIPPEFIRAIALPYDNESTAERIESLRSIEQLIEGRQLNCSLIACEFYFEDIRGETQSVDLHDKYKLYFLSWQSTQSNFEYLESLLEKVPSLCTFDSTVFPYGVLQIALSEKSENDYRPGWKLKYRKPIHLRNLSNSELSMLAVLDKIMNRSRLGLLSNTLETALGRLTSNELEGIDVSSQGDGYDQWCFRTAHQIQSAMVELMKQQRIGGSAKICFTMNGEQYSDVSYIAAEALGDLADLAEHLSDLYDCPNLIGRPECCSDPEAADLVLNWTSSDDVIDADVDDRTAHIFGFTLAGQAATYTPIQLQEPARTKPTLENLTFLLNYIFGFEEFREGQYPALLRALQRHDTIVLLPTGSGKSVIFQLLALITPGTAFIVSPITSLIDDQVQNLERRGIDRVVGLTGQTKDKRAVERSLATGSYLMCYVAPERFQILSFVNAVRNYSSTNLVSVVAIDEAHCVSEWGHDFRTSYLGLARNCRNVCSTGEYVPPLLALTGTASLSVLIDMKHDLGISGPGSTIRPSNFDRPEIHYRVISTKSDSKLDALDDILRRKIPLDLDLPANQVYQPTGSNDTNAGIIFCQNVNGSYGLLNSERAVESGHLGVWDYVEQILPGASTFYSGSKPKRLEGIDWDEAKRAQALSFKENGKSIMVATKAFGMGIDKPNVRWVVHFGMPGSMESYYQEVGRAARDRRDAYVYLILSDDYPQLNDASLDPAGTDLTKMKALEESKGQYKGDDISRCLYFHTGTFEGVEAEMRIAEDVLSQCTRDNYRFKKWVIPFGSSGDDSKNATERAIYRLALLGVFSNYNVEYHGGNHGDFIIEPAQANGKELKRIIYSNYRTYIKTYQSDQAFLEQAMASLASAVSGISDDRAFILAVLRHLLQTFTYRVIEEGRRRAIMTMLEAARRAASTENTIEAEENLRNEIIAYLNIGDDGEDEGLGSILYDATNVQKLLSIIKASDDDPRSMIQQALRLLEDYPQHYGLYYIAAALQAIEGSEEEMARSLRSMFLFGEQSYGLSKGTCAENFLAFLNDAQASRVSLEATNRTLDLLAELSNRKREDLLAEGKSATLARIRNIDKMCVLFPTIEKEMKWTTKTTSR